MREALTYKLLPVLILLFLSFTISARNQNIRKKNKYEWGFNWKWGYSQFFPLNNFSHYLKGGAGIQTEMDMLYKRFGFSASTNASFTKAKNNFIVGNTMINIKD